MISGTHNKTVQSSSSKTRSWEKRAVWFCPEDESTYCASTKVRILGMDILNTTPQSAQGYRRCSSTKCTVGTDGFSYASIPHIAVRMCL
jgi:hypothetical protein